MALVDLKTDLSKLKRDSFTSDIENKSKGIASGLNLDFGSFQPIENKFKEGVPQPNLDFGGSLDKPTPTVPTSMPGTPEKSSIVPKSFDSTLDKPTPTVPTSFDGTPEKPTPSIPTSFTGTPEKPAPTVPTSMLSTPEKHSIVPRSFDATLNKPTPSIPTSFAGTPEKHSIVPRSFDATLDKPVPVIPANWTVFAELAEKVSMFGELPKSEDPLGNLVSETRGTLDYVNYFSDIHATGFTGDRLFGDVRYPEGSEYIGIGSYENPGKLWFDTTPRGQLHEMWESNFPTLETHPHDEGISNPYYSSRDKLYGALEGWSDTQGTYFKYFKRNQNEIDFASRGTLKSAWDHGSVKLSIDDTGVPGIETNQYTKHSKTHLFPKGLLGDFTSFPNIPSKMDAYPPSILTIPRGGPVLTVKRGLKDVERHAKWFLSTKGIVWGLTQVGLQLLNARPETRIWNPLSLGSIIPTVHIPRHLQKIPLGINLQTFGVDTFRLGGETYTEAKDYISDPNSITLFGTTVNGPQSRLESQLEQWIEKDIERDDIGQGIINLKRQTPGQLIYLIPGGGGIFGNLSFRDVYSQRHISAAGISGESIHKSTDQMVHKALPSLGRYKTLSYGQLEAMSPSTKLNTDTGATEDIEGAIHGTTAQFGTDVNINPEAYSVGYGRVEGTGTIEGRYKFGSPGMTGKDRTDPLGGVNAMAPANNRLDTLDLLGVQGYIPSGNADPNSLLVDGTPLNIDKYKPLSGDYPDLIPLQFYDITNKAWIIFRAYVGKFNDSISPNWGSTDIAGRSQPMYYYQKTERKISFDFKVAATSKHELAPMWQKLNYLVGLCYPSFTKSTYPTMVNPFIKMTLGDVFHHVPGFISTLGVSPIENITWEIINDPKRGLARVPMGMVVNIEFTYVGDSLGSQRSPNHYIHAKEHSWVDYKDSYWQKGGAYPKNLQEPVPAAEANGAPK